MGFCLSHNIDRILILGARIPTSQKTYYPLVFSFESQLGGTFLVLYSLEASR